MARSYRIPKLATVSLVLGAGCGDDKEDPIDVSDGRIETLARATCEKMFECDPDGSKEEFDSVAECAASYEAYWSEYVSTYGKECTDAYLDAYECLSEATCGDNDACEELMDKAEELCDFATQPTGSSGLRRR